MEIKSHEFEQDQRTEALSAKVRKAVGFKIRMENQERLDCFNLELYI